jgi:hypothetical protein
MAAVPPAPKANADMFTVQWTVGFDSSRKAKYFYNVVTGTFAKSQHGSTRSAEAHVAVSD